MKRKQDAMNESQLVHAVDPHFVHVRNEKNLSRVGLWSAGQQSDDDQPASRTIRLTVRRDGRKIDTSITYDGSRGLPTMACLDKWMAFQRIAADIKKRTGKLTNPIAFPGHRLLREAGLSDAGKNYDALTAWGTRLAKTTMTSTQVIYLTNSRKYADETVGIFQKFRRVGQDDATGRAEMYEVWLADWLLDSLNSDYVYLEAYAPYLKLNRPIAKGLYNFLHYWFAENDGEYFAKDYLAICDLLNIKHYRQPSKIKLSIGPALNELVSIGYLSKWKIEKRLMDDRAYKVEFWPGKEILKNLHAIDPEKKKSRQVSMLDNGEDSLSSNILHSNLSSAAVNALSHLQEFGIDLPGAKRLLETNEPDQILDMIEYVSAMASEPGNTIRSPQSLLVSKLRNGAKIPSDFVTSRQRRAKEAARNWDEQKRQFEADLQLEYREWHTTQGKEELNRIYKGVALEKKLDSIADELAKSNKQFGRMSFSQKRDVARNQLVKELTDKLMLPTFEEWCKENPQRELFSLQ